MKIYIIKLDKLFPTCIDVCAFLFVFKVFCEFFFNAFVELVTFQFSHHKLQYVRIFEFSCVLVLVFELNAQIL